MITARVTLNTYTNKILNIIKAKYELNNKSEALNKFIEIYGPEEAEPEVKEEYIKKLLKIENEHFKKYGYKGQKLEDTWKEIEGE